MKTAAIIAEYNPFHNGHKYQIDKIKEITGAEQVIVLMSGDFVKSGAPAVCDKQYRIEAALKSGADLILELPVSYCVADRETYIKGAVEVLDRLGVVDCLAVGLKNGELKDIESSEKKEGEAADLRMAREILKALAERNSKIEAVKTPIIGAGYADNIFTPVAPSAAGIRNVLFGPSYTLQWNTYKNAMPSIMAKTLQALHEHNSLIERSDFSQILHFQILTQDEEKLASHPGISPELAKAIKDLQYSFISLESFAEKLEKAGYAADEIYRAFMEIILSVFEREAIEEIRVLGLRRDAADLLNEIPEKGSIKLLTNISDHKDIWQSDHIYDMIQAEKTGTFMHDELNKQMLYL